MEGKQLWQLEAFHFHPQLDISQLGWKGLPTIQEEELYNEK